MQGFCDHGDHHSAVNAVLYMVNQLLVYLLLKENIEVYGRMLSSGMQSPVVRQKFTERFGGIDCLQLRDGCLSHVSN